MNLDHPIINGVRLQVAVDTAIAVAKGQPPGDDASPDEFAVAVRAAEYLHELRAMGRSKHKARLLLWSRVVLLANECGGASQACAICATIDVGPRIVVQGYGMTCQPCARSHGAASGQNGALAEPDATEQGGSI